MKRLIYSIHILLLCSVCCNAQIGYQVSLLNSATGEPRANETVSVQVEITNSKGTVICSETKSATTNEFGVLSLQVGNASTFENVDWSKLPFYVSATVDGIMVGKSQILNVPVAEAAKTLVNVDPDLICKTWIGDESNVTPLKLVLNRDFTFSFYKWASEHWVSVCSGNYIVEGHTICVFNTSSNGYIRVAPTIIYHSGKLFWQYDSYYCSFY